jgi:hypothetical protein
MCAYGVRGHDMRGHEMRGYKCAVVACTAIACAFTICAVISVTAECDHLHNIVFCAVFALTVSGCSHAL